MWLVGPIVVALCIAFCLDWPVQALQKYLHVGRRLASTVVMIIFCSLVIAITVLIVPQVVKQGAEFYNSIIAFSLEPNGSSKAFTNTDSESTSTQSERPTYGEFYDSEVQSHSQDEAPNESPSNALIAIQNETKLSAAQDAQQVLGLDAASALTSSQAQAQAQANYDQLQDQGQSPTQGQASTQWQAQTPGQDQTQGPTVKENVATGPIVVHSSAAMVDYDFGADTSHTTTTTGNTENTGNIAYYDVNFTKERVPNPAQLINAALPESMRLPEYEDDGNNFKLTVADFDTRLAHEAYLVVLKLPEPIPSMLSIGAIKNAVRQGRIQSTAYLAELMRTQLMPSVINLFTWAVYLIIVPIFTFLMLYNKEELKKRAILFILPNNQVLMRKFWPSLHQQIAGYIRGKLLHIIIITIANSIAFKLLNVNYALLLGVGVGLSVVIPYVGAVIIAIPVVLVAIFQFGFSESLLWVLVIYTIIQLLDSNVLTPMLFSKAMNLDAFSILAAILIFGGLWGFWGVFFAIPLATFIKTIVMQWPNQDVREQQKREHLRLIHELKAEKAKSPRI